MNSANSSVSLSHSLTRSPVNWPGVMVKLINTALKTSPAPDILPKSFSLVEIDLLGEVNEDKVKAYAELLHFPYSYLHM